MVTFSEELNPQQLLAVNHVEGPLLVLAGAGSGKTRIITYRIVQLLEIGVPASEILAVTFTNKAAEEMRHRVEKLAHSFVLTCTFHSLCARILRESIHHLGFKSTFVIFDQDDSEKALKECFSTLEIKTEKGDLKAALAAISQAKNALVDPELFFKEDPSTLQLYRLYEARLKEYNAVDFDDLLFLTVKLFRQCPEVLETYQKRWNFLLIDEYQDTNAAQEMLIKLLSLRHKNVFAVGDPDQSIYSWRGANIDNILNFAQEYPGAKVLSLEQNYRSRNTILSAANALIKHNRGRYEKDLWSDLGAGEKIGLYICDNEQSEAEFVVKRLLKHHENENIPLKECVIFYRTNFQSRVFEDALLRHRVPYVIVGGLSFYQRREVKDILALLRVVVGGADFLAFSRMINIPKRGVGESTLGKLRLFAQEQGLDIVSACTGILQGHLPFKLSPKQQQGIKEYIEIILALREMLKQNLPLHELISEAIERSRYLDYLREDKESYAERRENVEELVSKAAEWEEEGESPSLTTFLEELSLKSSLDEQNLQADSVRLMTLHHGKGLEFTVVFMVGMEEDLFPHANTRDTSTGLEEERRLCYVGMTRAKEYLYLSASRYRFLWGGARIMRPSRFLSEIPQEYLQAFHTTRPSLQRQEEEPQEQEEGFSPGDSVVHREFGRGIVKKGYQTSLGLTYDIFFPQTDSMRTLVAKYAKLQKES